MRHLQTINEYQRTVGFRYSAPKESYNIDLLLKEDITTGDGLPLNGESSMFISTKSPIALDFIEAAIHAASIVKVFSVSFSDSIFTEELILQHPSTLTDNLSLLNVIWHFSVLFLES